MYKIKLKDYNDIILNFTGEKMRVGVIIKTTDNFWTVTRFADEEPLKIFMRMAAVQLGDRIKSMDIVQLDPYNPLPPPDGFEATLELHKEHLYWCPWCGEMRYFVSSWRYKDYLFCSTCHISDADFNIRKFNRLDFYNGMTSYNGAGGGKRLARKQRKEKREKLSKKVLKIEDDD
jgi:hypothetical protein